MVLSDESDAKRVLAVLPKRFEKYGFTLHPEKTQLVAFERPRGNEKPPKGPDGGKSFDFLGFTHYWGKSRKGNYVVQRKTAGKRFRSAVKRMNEWCRSVRHFPVIEQWRQLCLKLTGYYNYYGIPGNWKSLHRFWYHVRRLWQKWLNRRAHKAKVTWEKMTALLNRYPVPLPHVFNPYIPLILGVCEPRSRMR